MIVSIISFVAFSLRDLSRVDSCVKAIREIVTPCELAQLSHDGVKLQPFLDQSIKGIRLLTSEPLEVQELAELKFVQQCEDRMRLEKNGEPYNVLVACDVSNLELIRIALSRVPYMLGNSDCSFVKLSENKKFYIDPSYRFSWIPPQGHMYSFPIYRSRILAGDYAASNSSGLSGKK